MHLRWAATSISLLVARAGFAGEPVLEDLIGLDDVVSVDTSVTPVYRFELPSCDKVKASFRDLRPDADKHTQKVVVTLVNTTESTCLYRGLVLKGFLEGTYVSSHKLPEDAGFFIPPKGELSLRISVADPSLPRAEVQLQIPPERGMVVLIGKGPESVGVSQDK